MWTVAILSQKGGAGKTTLALNLAVAAELVGDTAAIIDLDPQASATGWKDTREAATPAVVSAQAARLPQMLSAAEESGAKLAIIDTAPHSENSSLTAARIADLILIPCRPALLDLRAIGLTVDLAKLANTPAFVVLNAVPARGSLADEAATALATYDVALCPIRIGQRMAYVHALTAGQGVPEYEPDGKAASEILQLYTWTRKHVYTLANRSVNLAKT